MSATSESPAELLERAAARLDALVADPTLAKAPWKADGSVVWAADDYLILGGAPWDNDKEPDADADWIATMGPGVAGPLASMLRFDAMRLGWAERCEDVDKSYLGFELARQILGDPLPDYYGKEE